MDQKRYRRLKELVDQALDLPDYERDVFLQKNCDDAELLSEARDLLHFHGTEVDGLPGNVVLSADLPNLINSRIGPYQILDPLGEGGMGVVYLAAQSAPLRRKVALKVIKLGMDTREVMARFESERQALAMMDHPNIAKVFDAGATDEGRPYFVMEYIPGVPLTRYCEEENLDLQQRLDLFIQVCRGVQHAHQKGIIHRDLKPGNILVAEIEGKPVPKIIDFGVAKATASNLAGQTMFTRLGQMIGTPEYMSPEQAGSSMTDVDTRSDVYSLGVLLYELLTGSLPLERQEILQAGLQRMALHVQNEIPKKPSTRIDTQNRQPDSTLGHSLRDTRLLARQVRGDLDWITMKALEKDRDRRYGTVADLEADILRHRQNEPVLAGPPGAGYRLRKYFRRHRTGVTVGALLVTALVLGTIGTTIGMIRAERAEQAALAANRQVEAGYLYQLARNEVLPTRQLALATRALELDDRPESRRLAQQLLLKGPSFFQLPKATDAHNPHNLTYSPDGHWLAVGWTKRGLIQLFDTRTGELHELDGQVGGISTLSFSKDSRLLVASFTDDRIQLWSVPDRKRIRVWEMAGTPFPWFTKNDKALLVGVLHEGERPTWLELELEGDGRREFGQIGGIAKGEGLDLDPSRRWLAHAVGDRLELYDLEHPSELPMSVLGTHSHPILGVLFTPDGDRVLSFDAHGKARLWSLAPSGDQPLREFHCTPNATFAKFSPDGTRLTLGGSGKMLLWDLNLPSIFEPLELDTSNNWMFAGVFSPDGKWLATTGTHRMVAMWPCEREYPLTVRPSSEDASNTVFSPDGKWMVSLEIGKVWAWPLEGTTIGEPILRYEAPDFGFTGVRFDDSVRNIFLTTCNSSQGTGTILRIPLDGGPVHTWTEGTCHIEVSPDGRFIAASKDEGLGKFNITVWDTEAGTVRQLAGPGSQVVAGFTPDSRLLAWGDGVLGLWEVEGWTFEKLRDEVDGVLLAPDRTTYLFSNGSEGSFLRGRVGSEVTEALPQEFIRASLYSVGMDSTCTLLTSGCPKGELEVLDMKSGRHYLVPLHDRRSWIATVDPKGRWLTSTAVGETRLMRPPTGRPINELPIEEFLEMLRGQTNVRVAKDPNSETGYNFVVDDSFDWTLPPVPGF